MSDSKEEVIPCSLPPSDDVALSTNSWPDKEEEEEEEVPSSFPLRCQELNQDVFRATNSNNTSSDEDDGDDVVTSTQQTNRATNYSENEILILARAWIKVSTDPATGTDQKSAAFWHRITIAYAEYVATANNKHSKTDGYTMLPEERSSKSLKSQWHNRLLPIASKFAGIIATNPLKSESIKKLKFDLEKKRLEKELQTGECPSSEEKNESDEILTMFKTPQATRHSEHHKNGCCWNDSCLFIGMSGPNLDECGRSDCISGERFHHACMVNWVEQHDPNPECLKLCRDCCIKKYCNRYDS